MSAYLNNLASLTVAGLVNINLTFLINLSIPIQATHSMFSIVNIPSLPKLILAATRLLSLTFGKYWLF